MCTSLREGVARVRREDCRYVRSRRHSLFADRWWGIAVATPRQAHAAAARMLAGRADPVVEDCIGCPGDRRVTILGELALAFLGTVLLLVVLAIAYHIWRYHPRE